MNIVFLTGLIVVVATAVPVALQLRRHPRGLAVLFFAEMWERFSYYGMRAIFIFYLTQHFLLDDAKAQGQYGAYTSLVYLLPLIGGLLADRVLGARKAIAFGALLLVAGHLTMAVEGRPAVQTLTYGGATYEFVAQGQGEARQIKLKVGDGLYAYGPRADGGLVIQGLPANSPLPVTLAKGSYQMGVTDRDPAMMGVMYLALSLIIMGVGFLKANISSIVGALYPTGDPRRDGGFTLYYYGINLGALLASAACGFLGQEIGWWAGFGAAGIGMVLGYLVFVFGKPLLDGHGEPPKPERLKARLIGLLNIEWTIYILAVLGTGLVWLLVAREALVGWCLAAGSIAVLGYLAWFMIRHCTKVEAQRIGLALLLIAASVVFWTLFEQAGSSMNLYAERNTNLSVGFGQSMAASQTQMFNAGFILIGAPIFAALWAWLGARGKDLNPMVKFGLALVQVGLGFLLLVWGSHFHDAAYRVPLIFLAGAYLLHTTGELCLSPVGLSQMTKLAVPAVVSTLMATWFLASSWAQYIGGQVAKLTASETIAGQVLDPAAALATYARVFRDIGLWGIAAGILMLILSPWLRKWAHGADETHPLSHVEVDGDRQSVEHQV